MKSAALQRLKKIGMYLQKNRLVRNIKLYIYILKDGKFVILRSSSASEARSASVALSLIQSEVSKLAV
jgi:hypothetical protein